MRLANLTLTGSPPNINLLINTDQAVAGAELHLSFDPQFIKLNSFSAGDFLKNPNIMDFHIDNANGAASLTLLASPGNTPTGQGVIASLNLTSLQAGSTTISIAPQTKIAVVGQAQNALGQTTDLTLNLTETQIQTAAPAQISPTPTPILRQKLSPTIAPTTISPAPLPSDQLQTKQANIPLPLFLSILALAIISTISLIVLLLRHRKNNL